MFRGQFHHTIDAKGRISLPVRFRELLLARSETRFVITPAPFEPCLHLFALPAWEELEQKISALPALDANVVRFQRLYVSAAIECELDKAGRMLAPPHLRERAALKGDVLFAGMGRRIELWSKEQWAAAIDIPSGELPTFRRAVEQFGI